MERLKIDECDTIHCSAACSPWPWRKFCLHFLSHRLLSDRIRSIGQCTPVHFSTNERRRPRDLPQFGHVKAETEPIRPSGTRHQAWRFLSMWVNNLSSWQLQWLGSMIGNCRIAKTLHSMCLCYGAVNKKFWRLTLLLHSIHQRLGVAHGIANLSKFDNASETKDHFHACVLFDVDSFSPNTSNFPEFSSVRSLNAVISQLLYS